jgi:ADP-ribosylglycohydrolase
MALSIVENLNKYGEIHQDELSGAFIKRYMHDPQRGYGRGAADLLVRCARGEDWREAAPTLFRGGSYGNGAAMRVGPLGAFYKGDPERAAQQARLSAEVTHAHPEGQAGAIAVAVAAAIAASSSPSSGRDFINEVISFVPDGETKERIKYSLDIREFEHAKAIDELGTGIKVSSQDTVPYCLWCAAYNLDSFENAMWTTVMGLGDSDTTCAIVGGIVALSASVPREWIKRREPLPADFRKAF